MLGMIVEVYTSDDQRFLYEITEVPPPPAGARRRRSTPTHEQLWLQTSEGPKGTPGKTQVVAEPLPDAPRGPRRRPTRRRTRSSAAEPDGALRSSRSGAARSRGADRDDDHDRGDEPEAAASPPPSAVAGLAHPEDPGDRADARPG